MWLIPLGHTKPASPRPASSFITSPASKLKQRVISVWKTNHVHEDANFSDRTEILLEDHRKVLDLVSKWSNRAVSISFAVWRVNRATDTILLMNDVGSEITFCRRRLVGTNNLPKYFSNAIKVKLISCVVWRQTSREWGGGGGGGGGRERERWGRDSVAETASIRGKHLFLRNHQRKKEKQTNRKYSELPEYAGTDVD